MLTLDKLNDYLTLQKEIENQYGLIFKAIRKADIEFKNEYNPNYRFKLPHINVSWQAKFDKEKIDFDLLCYDGGGGCDVIKMSLPLELMIFSMDELNHYFQNYEVYQEKEKLNELLESKKCTTKLKI